MWYTELDHGTERKTLEEKLVKIRIKHLALYPS